MKSTLNQMLESRTELTPDKIAVVDVKGHSRTYREFLDRSSRIQSLFPIDEPRRIGIVLDCNASLVEVLLAVVRSGAMAVPVDPQVESFKIKDRFNNLGVEFVITSPIYASRVAGFLQMHLSENGLSMVSYKHPAEEIDETEPIFYDGERKHTHQEVMNSILDFRKNSGLVENDKYLTFADADNIQFLIDSFATFISGGTLIVLPRKHQDSLSARKILELCAAEEISLLRTPDWFIKSIEKEKLSVSPKLRFYKESDNS